MTLPSATQIQRIFITGIQGLIGWNLYQSLQADYEVEGFSQATRSRDGEWYEHLIEDYETISKNLEASRPDVVIHTQALCKLELCEEKPHETDLINVKTTQKLIQSLNPAKHRLVYISSEHVFSGEKGNYSEEDPTDPISVHGKSRVEAEKVVRESYPGALIIRPGLVIGQSQQGDIGPRDWLRSRLARGLTASFFVDEIRSPIRMRDFIQGLMLLIHKGCSGIYHLAGRDKISRYDLARRLAHEWNQKGDIQPKYRLDDKILPRIGDCSLSSSKAQKEGWIIPPFATAQNPQNTL